MQALTAIAHEAAKLASNNQLPPGSRAVPGARGAVGRRCREPARSPSEVSASGDSDGSSRRFRPGGERNRRPHALVLAGSPNACQMAGAGAMCISERYFPSLAGPFFFRANKQRRPGRSPRPALHRMPAAPSLTSGPNSTCRASGQPARAGPTLRHVSETVRSISRSTTHLRASSLVAPALRASS